MADATGLDADFADRIGKMINASGGKIWINSGFRSTERQAQLYAAATEKYGSPEAARKYVAPPGKSNHNFGLAVDLGGDLELAHSLAPQFGLTFPMGWEPWHVEPPWARSARGDDYKNSHTTPPPGMSDQTAPDAQLGSLEHQLSVFQSILKGEDVSGYMEPPGTAPASETGTPSEPGAAGGTEGAVDPAALYQALRAQGVDAPHAAALVGIAGRESGYKTGSHNPNRATGDDSWGLFQINLLNGMHSNYNPQMLTTMEGSAQAAAEMVKSGGLQPWGPYKGVSWASGGVDLEAAAAASGGEVTLADLQGIENEGLR